MSLERGVQQGFKRVVSVGGIQDKDSEGVVLLLTAPTELRIDRV